MKDLCKEKIKKRNVFSNLLSYPYSADTGVGFSKLSHKNRPAIFYYKFKEILFLSITVVYLIISIKHNTIRCTNRIYTFCRDNPVVFFFMPTKVLLNRQQYIIAKHIMFNTGREELYIYIYK